MGHVIRSERSRSDPRSIDNRLTAKAGGTVSGRPLSGMAIRAIRALGTSYLIVHRCRGDEVEIARIRRERENWQTEG